MTVEQHQRQLQHDAIFYDDECAFASAAVSFVREGLARDEIVMVNTGSNAVTSLLRALFDGEEQVSFADRPVYSTPANALDGYRRTMERGLAAGVQGYRAMGFIDFEAGPLPWQEWLRYEAAVNHVFADYPFKTLCPYDVSALPHEITDAIMRAHTGLVDKAGWHLNGNYVEPAKLVLADGLVTPLHPLQETSPRMVLEPSTDLMELRLEVYSATMFTDLSPRKVDDFVAAVGQVVENAHQHGRAPVRLKLWAADAAVVCTVTDQGPGIEDPLVGYARPKDPVEGLGLWAVRQLCDVLDYHRDEDGFTVRLASFL
ncbi:MAG TPA: sensor histidine kinase [Nocardioidaceae bacterium]|nr:sensor histidine kinase [Nocardioidaceae bacterium]